MLVTAGTTMIALTSIAIVVLTSSSNGVPIGEWGQISLMVFASSCATIFVLGLLYSDLQGYYNKLADRERLAQKEARLDGLTGLPNRKDLYEDLGRAEDSRNNCLAILDLDEFKSVNDTMGHAIGDELLKEVSRRISDNLPSNCKAYRLGGDEFALILLGCQADEAVEICKGICEIVTQDYCLTGSEVAVGCSIGVSETQSGLSISDALRHSDLAMYEAKSARSGVKLFDAKMAEELERKTQLGSRLRLALEQNLDIAVKFQPIFNVRNEIAALEGLFRWRDNRHGVVRTKEAIEVAKKNRLLNKITLFVIEESCSHAQPIPDAKLCFNLEAVQLLDRNFIDQMIAQISRGLVPRNRIQLEFAERDLVDYSDKVGPVISHMASLGFLMAVDDFGSSNASLTHLANLGVSEVKFDPSVLHFARVSENISVIKAKTGLAHSLGMSVTCKGISSSEDEAIARQSGCDFLQGYRMGRPHPLDVFRKSQALRADIAA